MKIYISKRLLKIEIIPEYILLLSKRYRLRAEPRYLPSLLDSFPGHQESNLTGITSSKLGKSLKGFMIY